MEWMNYFKQLLNIEHINKYKNADMYLSHDNNKNIKILNSNVTTRYRMTSSAHSTLY